MHVAKLLKNEVNIKGNKLKIELSKMIILHNNRL